MNKSISERHGRAMSGLEKGQQIYVLNEVAANHLSVKETEKLVKSLREKAEGKPGKKARQRRRQGRQNRNQYR